MQFKNHGSELKYIHNIFQPPLAVSAQHNKRLRLKFITSSQETRECTPAYASSCRPA